MLFYAARNSNGLSLLTFGQIHLIMLKARKLIWMAKLGIV